MISHFSGKILPLLFVCLIDLTIAAWTTPQFKNGSLNDMFSLYVTKQNIDLQMNKPRHSLVGATQKPPIFVIISNQEINDTYEQKMIPKGVKN